MEITTLTDYIQLFSSPERFPEYLQKSTQKMTNKTLYVSGDIHGDITLLLTILGELSESCNIDVAKLPEFYTRKFSSVKDATDYIDSIPVSWREETKNKQLIFCGDTIDNQRTPVYNSALVVDEEIKVILTMYKLQRDALKNPQNGNMLWKVIGNHELYNYVAPDILFNYYGDEKIGDLKRIDYMTYENRANNFFYYISFYAFPILMINQDIFLHGGVERTFTHSDEQSGQILQIGQEIQRGNSEYIRRFNQIVFQKIRTIQPADIRGEKIYRSGTDSPLWTRIYSELKYIQEQENFEKVFVPEFAENNIRIFVGHCPNTFYQDYPKMRDDWRNYVVKRGNVRKTGNKKVYTIRDCNDTEMNNTITFPSSITKAQNSDEDPLDKIFGISMNIVNKQCSIKLFRMDIAAAYSFDVLPNNLDSIDEYKKMIMTFYGRKPQIIGISTDKQSVELHKIRTGYYYEKFDKTYFKTPRVFNGKMYKELIAKLDGDGFKFNPVYLLGLLPLLFILSGGRK